jgi:DinB superfamily
MSSTAEEVSQDLRYPVGRFKSPETISAEDRAAWIDIIQAFPEKLEAAVKGLSDTQLNTPYRPGGWTVRQVVHHLADSHSNASIRMRFALTEDAPAILAYDEAQWALLPDAKDADPSSSLALIRGLHERWTILLRALNEQQFARTFRHPELGELRLDWTLGLYAWHSRHHVAHITSLKARQGWQL